MTTWVWAVGWTWILAASTGLGRDVGFTVGGPHGPGLIVSHHRRASLRSDHRQLWFRQFNSQTGYARKHLQCTLRPTLTHMHKHTLLFIHHTWPQENRTNFFFLYPIWVSCQSSGKLVAVVPSATTQLRGGIALFQCPVGSTHVL